MRKSILIVVLSGFVLLFAQGKRDDSVLTDNKPKEDQIKIDSIIELNEALKRKADSLFQTYEPNKQIFLSFVDTIEASFDAGDLKKTKISIEKLQKVLPEFEDNWNFGNATHKINIYLGRLALKKGDIEAAKEHLLQAGRTKGSPQLNSFGPNMLLAKDLLDAGESNVVLEYLDLCLVFWEEQERVDGWKAEIKGGSMPDFGANLKY